MLVALIGFWEWRSALLLALSIPLTLAMTFGMMSMLGIDLQQISIASLIIALGLLVDDPVVAGDAIKRDLDHGQPPLIASWLGPTKLARAILYATITNIVAYLPLLLLSGTVGQFLFSLPVVLTCSLVASRLVSMTFIPLLGYYLLRPSRKPTPPDRGAAPKRVHRLVLPDRPPGHRSTAGGWRSPRWSCWSLGGCIASQLKPQYFPKDLQYLSYVEVWLPEDAPLIATRETTEQVEGLIRQHAARVLRASRGRARRGRAGLAHHVHGRRRAAVLELASRPSRGRPTTRLIVMQTRSKHDTPGLVQALQDAAVARGDRGAGRRARAGDRPSGRHRRSRSGSAAITCRPCARSARRADGASSGGIRMADRIQDDWGAESFAVDVAIDPDRANRAGLTNADVAASTAIGLNGLELTACTRATGPCP